MPSKNTKKFYRNKEVALIFVEGDTEVEFYKVVFTKYMDGIAKKSFNLNGNYNIYGKIIDKTVHYLTNNPGTLVRIYCFIDRESRYHNPPLDENTLISKFESDNFLNDKILSLNVILATQMIESWFFYDIEGIYRFLRTPKKDRCPKKYKVIEKLNSYDLSKLFSRYGNIYIKGKRCKFFIDHLDIEKIFKNCTELRNGIELIINNCNRV